MRPDYALYLHGRWQQPGPALDVINPATGETFARVATVRREDVTKAVEVAARAFESWRKQPACDRGALLFRIADQLEHHADEIARVITLENGKPLPQSKGEVAMTVDHFRWFAEEARRAYGRVVPHQTGGKRHLVVKSPVGVVAAFAFTRDLNRTLRLTEELEAGTIGINDAAPATSQCPFGGLKQSGLGRELGSEGLDAYLETKHISIGGVS